MKTLLNSILTFSIISKCTHSEKTGEELIEEAKDSGLQVSFNDLLNSEERRKKIF